MHTANGYLRAGDILVVDADPDVCLLLREFLSDEGYVVRTALSLDEARMAIDERKPALILLDVLPDGFGTELVQELRAAGQGVPVVLMTTTPQAFAPFATKHWVTCIPKPFDLTTLLACVQPYMRRVRDT